MRILVRMADNRALLARINQRMIALRLSKRRLCLKAGPPASPDSIRMLEKGHAPRREVLRVLATALECPLEYLEEVAPDVRVDSRADDTRREWLDLFDAVCNGDRERLLEMIRAYVRGKKAT